MNTVVNKLLDVDKQARLILDEAQQYYDRTIADIELEKQSIKTSYENKARAHYDEIEAAERSAIADALKETRDKYSRLTTALDEIYEKGHVNWENELFKRCLGHSGE